MELTIEKEFILNKKINKVGTVSNKVKILEIHTYHILVGILDEEGKIKYRESIPRKQPKKGLSKEDLKNSEVRKVMLRDKNDFVHVKTAKGFDIKQLIKWHNEGLTYKKIAKRLNSNPASVGKFIRENGYRFNKSKNNV